jgi:superoxide dismutase, Fe-Mn family
MALSAFSRRHFFGTAAGIAAVATSACELFGQAPAAASEAPPSGPIEVPPLGYPTNAFEPFIDSRTMEIHHDKHHAAYVTALNVFAKDHPEIAKRSTIELLANLETVPDAIRTAVRNNLGGHANHSMFWEIMGPNGGEPEGEVLSAIDRDFGGLERLQADFNSAGGRQFGSGWVFVTVTTDGKLKIETRSNQDTPVMDGKRVLFGNDVWEHSYYLRYQNRRLDYLNAWWNTVNWAKIAERYAAAKAGMLGI